MSTFAIVAIGAISMIALAAADIVRWSLETRAQRRAKGPSTSSSSAGPRAPASPSFVVVVVREPSLRDDPRRWN